MAGARRSAAGRIAAVLAFPVLLTTWLPPQSRGAGRTQDQRLPPHAQRPEFQTSDNCLACHNRLTTPDGEDVSIGSAWRGSMMANSSRDPYWQASVRREVIDHPSHRAEIEDECSTCHMPMARARSRGAGRPGEVFAHLPLGGGGSENSRLAADGVSCTLCHQIRSDRLGAPDSFTGGFVVTPPTSSGSVMFGPSRISAGTTRVMHSATGTSPVEAAHVQRSELCATCHTLFTRALGPDGTIVGTLPEQVPYLEWQHSAFRAERSCQSCHMPEVERPTPVASVVGEPRSGLSRHGFAGGNFFMLRMLNRYRAELGVVAEPLELDASARATVALLESQTAAISVAAARTGRALEMVVVVGNLTGHKFPTGYPSRRAWLHVTVRDRDGGILFESGAVEPSGAIRGNDNDADPLRHEPHYDTIRQADQVQIYESMMVDRAGTPTTGLLRGVRFAKDNRLLPRGFDKATAAADIAVHGEAATDADFAADGDRVRYVVDVSDRVGPLTIDVELRYQPISFRWAQNLAAYDGDEPRRFVSYFNALAAQSSMVVARAGARVP